MIIRSYNGSARSETAGCRIESIDWTRRNSRARKDAARLSVPSAAATSAALCVYVKGVPIVRGTSAGRRDTVNAHRNERIVSFTISNDTVKGVRPDLILSGSSSPSGRTLSSVSEPPGAMPSKAQLHARCRRGMWTSEPVDACGEHMSDRRWLRVCRAWRARIGKYMRVRAKRTSKSEANRSPVPVNCMSIFLHRIRNLPGLPFFCGSTVLQSSMISSSAEGRDIDVIITVCGPRS